ncbi:MAG: hydroxyethylthiazole kinase, partial [Actinomycetota bacterium]|nr:hydroxyethylthiazole kinase [Actinomycetota bacterium]
MPALLRGGTDRIASARALAGVCGAVTLLKGTRTVIAPVEGTVRVNPTGTPVLATAGTGDVLTGVIGGLMARGVDPLEAATAGAFLHGIAGQLAGSDTGVGTLASDVIERLPDALTAVSA